MFTKNIKLIGIVALIVVIVMVLSAVIAINNDKKVAGQLGSAVENVNGSVNAELDNVKKDYEDEIANVKKDYEEKIAELNTAITNLKDTLAKVEAGLADASDVIEAQGALIEALEKVNSDLVAELDKWGEATLAYSEKILEAEKIYMDFIMSFEDEDAGLDAEDYFAYVTGWTFDEEGYIDELTYCFETFFELGEDLEFALSRAESVEEMDELLAQYKADLEAVPTRVEALETALAALEGRDLVYGDYEAIMYANYLAFEANDALFAPATEESDGEFAAIAARFDVLAVAYGPVVLDHFVEVASTLPEAYAVLYSHKETIETLMDDVQLITSLLSDEQLGDLAEDEAFTVLVDNYIDCVERLPEVIALYEEAEVINEWLAEQVKDVEFKADIKTREFLNTLYARVDAWVAINGIVVDVEAKDYVADIYNYVDHSILAACEAVVLEDGAELKAEADAFIAAVNAIGKITPKSEAALDAAVLAYGKVSSDPATIDTIFAMEENGVVAAWAKVRELQADYETILKAIDDFNKAFENIFIKCEVTHGEDEECDCENIGEINPVVADTIDCDVIDSYIITILGTYELEITEFKAEYVAAYKVIRLYDDIAAIEALVLDAASRSTLSDEDIDKQIENIAKLVLADAATAYTFEVAVEECDCGAICVADHGLVIVENAAEKALAKYTKTYVDGFFAVELPVIGAPELQ